MGKSYCKVAPQWYDERAFVAVTKNKKEITHDENF